MRLSNVLSESPNTKFAQVEGFLSKPLPAGSQRKLSIGQIASNYFCVECSAIRTFWSDENVYCIGVDSRQISIDCVLKCRCGESVTVWFLVESYEEKIVGLAPNVRILKRREKLSDHVRLAEKKYADYTDLLDKAERAFRDGLGAGSLVYLRKIYEQITEQTANAVGIPCTHSNGKRKPFKQLLEEVDKKRPIIPEEFRKDGYRLFGDLSDVVHGEYDEQIGLSKFEPLHRLIVGILDNVNNSIELQSAVGSLGWHTEEGVAEK